MTRVSCRGVALALLLTLLMLTPRAFTQGSRKTGENRDARDEVSLPRHDGPPIWIDGELTGDLIRLSVVLVAGSGSGTNQHGTFTFWRLPDMAAGDYPRK